MVYDVELEEKRRGFHKKKKEFYNFPNFTVVVY